MNQRSGKMILPINKNERLITDAFSFFVHKTDFIICIMIKKHDDLNCQNITWHIYREKD